MALANPIQCGLLRKPDVFAKTGLPESTRTRLIQKGLFPKPVRIAGTRTVAWSAESIDQWLAAQISGVKAT